MSDVLRVDPIACDAHGLCAELVPELIRLDEWGYPIVPGTPVPRGLEKHAKRAVAACPALALALVRDEARQSRRLPAGEPEGAGLSETRDASASMARGGSMKPPYDITRR